MTDHALQHAIRWNLRERDRAKARKNARDVNHFQRNIDQLRAQARATPLTVEDFAN